MRLRIRHLTHYRYDQWVDYSIQTLRLTPRDHDSQRVLSWRVTGDGARVLPMITDGLGNHVHCHSVNRPHRESSVLVEGEIETLENHGVVVGAPEPLPPAYYLRSTPLTAADEALTDLAHQVPPDSGLARMHGLMALIRDRIDYRIGMTEARTTAADALAAGAGVCQDHAHAFIACARA